MYNVTLVCMCQCVCMHVAVCSVVGKSHDYHVTIECVCVVITTFKFRK